MTVRDLQLAQEDMLRNLEIYRKTCDETFGGDRDFARAQAMVTRWTNAIDMAIEKFVRKQRRKNGKNRTTSKRVPNLEGSRSNEECEGCTPGAAPGTPQTVHTH